MKRKVNYFIIEFIAALIFYLAAIFVATHPEGHCILTVPFFVLNTNGIFCRVFFILFPIGLATFLLYIAIQTLRGKIIPPK